MAWVYSEDTGWYDEATGQPYTGRAANPNAEGPPPSTLAAVNAPTTSSGGNDWTYSEDTGWQNRATGQTYNGRGNPNDAGTYVGSLSTNSIGKYGDQSQAQIQQYIAAHPNASYGDLYNAAAPLGLVPWNTDVATNVFNNPLHWQEDIPKMVPGGQLVTIGGQQFLTAPNGIRPIDIGRAAQENSSGLTGIINQALPTVLLGAMGGELLAGLGGLGAVGDAGWTSGFDLAGGGDLGWGGALGGGEAASATAGGLGSDTLASVVPETLPDIPIPADAGTVPNLTGTALDSAGSGIKNSIINQVAQVTGLPIDQAKILVNAVQGAGTSAVTGGNPLIGAVTGGLSGPAGDQLSQIGLPDSVNSAIIGGARSALNGGDPVMGAVTGGAGSLATDQLNQAGITGTPNAAIVGAGTSLLNGRDPVTGALTGATGSVLRGGLDSVLPSTGNSQDTSVAAVNPDTGDVAPINTTLADLQGPTLSGTALSADNHDLPMGGLADVGGQNITADNNPTSAVIDGVRYFLPNVGGTLDASLPISTDATTATAVTPSITQADIRREIDSLQGVTSDIAPPNTVTSNADGTVTGGNNTNSLMQDIMRQMVGLPPLGTESLDVNGDGKVDFSDVFASFNQPAAPVDGSTSLTSQTDEPPTTTQVNTTPTNTLAGVGAGGFDPSLVIGSVSPVVNGSSIATAPVDGSTSISSQNDDPVTTTGVNNITDGNLAGVGTGLDPSQIPNSHAVNGSSVTDPVTNLQNAIQESGVEPSKETSSDSTLGAIGGTLAGVGAAGGTNTSPAPITSPVAPVNPPAVDLSTVTEANNGTVQAPTVDVPQVAQPAPDLSTVTTHAVETPQVATPQPTTDTLSTVTNPTTSSTGGGTVSLYDDILNAITGGTGTTADGGIPIPEDAGTVPDLTGTALDPNTGADNSGAGPVVSTGGTGGTPGGSTGGVSGSTAGTALSRLLGGTASQTDILSLLGTGAQGLLGAYGASQQASAARDIANQFASYGAPYRQQLSDLTANPSSFLTSAPVQTSVQQGTDALARSLSMHGNPTGSGAALQQLQNYSTNSLYDKLGQEKDRLAGFGGLTSYNQAAPAAATNASNATGNIYQAAGSTLGSIFNPAPSATDTLSQLRRLLGGSGGIFGNNP